MKRLSHWLIAAAAAVLSAVLPAQSQELFPTGAEWRYFKGTQAPSTPDATAWRAPGFDDGSWLAGNAAFFYGEALTGTQLDDMQGNYSTVFLRKQFQVVNPADFKSVTLKAACDDGFICWINGTEVVRFNVPEGELGFDGTASGAVSPDPAQFNDYPVANPGNVLKAGVNVIAVQLFNVNLSGSSDAVWDASLAFEADNEAPVITRLDPPSGASLRELFAIEVNFSEPVNGVEAADLLIGGQPATNVVEVTPGQFVFSFPKAANGTVTAAFRANHGITDKAATPHPFSGGSWNYTVDSNQALPGLLISEFMTDNDGVIRDENGDESDWIEIFNSSTQAIPLLGWALTDEEAKLGKWRFPNRSLAAGARLVVFASGKDRAPVNGQLHTNFKLNNEGEFLGLISPGGEVVSAFAPIYPEQRKNVSYGRANGAPNVLGYFDKPTPGAANTSSGAGFAPEIRFSRKGGTFATPFSLELSLKTPLAGAVIRYTLDGTLPTEATPSVYSSPLTVTNTLLVRARAFASGLLPGDPRGEMFLKVEGTAPTITSDLPMMILHNFGGGRPPATGQQPAYMHLFEPVGGVTSITNPPTLSRRVGIGARGSSTLGYPKVSMNLELRDEFDEDKKHELLGMPEDSDWVLYAPNNFEPILIHNPYAHQLSRDIGRYSPRTRFVEVYLITDRVGTVRYPGTYAGIYVLEERITRSPDRVDVDKLEPEHTKVPEVTGGYMLKVDRTGPGEGGFWAGGQGMVFVDPSEAEMRSAPYTAQMNYLQNYFDSFGNALYGDNWKDPVTGYRAYIDTGAWIDHHLMNVLTFNVDALRLSAYLYKPRNGKITFGPLWDFDRALNSTDGRDSNPKVWRSQVSDRGTDYFNETTQAWWGRLFQDIDFYQEWIDRYQTLRRDQFATTNLWRLVDTLTDQVRKAQPREQAKWGVVPSGGYQGQINGLRLWLSNRVTFMDSQFIASVTNDTPGGRFTNAFTVRLTGPTNGTIYYMLNGTDPRLPGGGVRAGAQVGTGGSPIAISANARLVARVNNNAHTARTNTANGDPPLTSKWSGPTAVTYFNVLPPLLLTEIMFHPADPPTGSTNSAGDFEFVELKNTSAQTLSLIGFSLAGGVDYTFTAASGVTSLAPGARVLVVKNRTAFLARYPGTTGIAGEYTGKLSDSDNRIRVLGPLQEPISDVRYTDAWAPLADGFGFSLVVRDEATAPENLGTADQWRLSAHPGGSPGAADPAPNVPAPVLVNEALTHTDPPLLDTIELFNPGNNPVNLGGWWLTDDYREPKKYQIPAGTNIVAGGFVIIDETQFRAGGAGFSFSALGDEVHLFSADAAGELTGWHHGFSFGASFNGVSFGRFLSSDLVEHFVPLVTRTLGAVNSKPVVGPLVITEIHAEPSPNGTNNNELDEFIEVRNVTSAPLPLFDVNFSTNTWHIRGGVDFDFPMQVTLPAGGFALVVGFDPLEQALADAFRTKFNVPTEVRLFGPWEGTLNNAGENVELHQPDEPVAPPAANAGEVPYVTTEEVDYRPLAPWPTDAAGTGKSLQRLRSVEFGNDPANWQAANPTAGRQNNAGDVIGGPADADADGLPDEWESEFGLSNNSGVGDDGPDGDPDGDGQTNRDEYIAGTHPKQASSRFVVEAVPGAGVLGVQFPAAAGRSYSVWYRESLTDGDWQLLTSFGPQASNGLLTAEDSSGRAPRFYQVTVALP